MDNLNPKAEYFDIKEVFEEKLKLPKVNIESVVRLAERNRVDAEYKRPLLVKLAFTRDKFEILKNAMHKW